MSNHSPIPQYILTKLTSKEDIQVKVWIKKGTPMWEFIYSSRQHTIDNFDIIFPNHIPAIITGKMSDELQLLYPGLTGPIILWDGAAIKIMAERRLPNYERKDWGFFINGPQIESSCILRTGIDVTYKRPKAIASRFFQTGDVIVR